MRVGIYGGTFSPVHNGHVAAARAFMEQMWLDILYVIPTGVTPHKDMKGDATASDRLEMCRLAFGGMEGVIVSDLEMRREGKSYTVDTLRELYDPDGRLFLLMGTDMLGNKAVLSLVSGIPIMVVGDCENICRSLFADFRFAEYHFQYENDNCQHDCYYEQNQS